MTLDQVIVFATLGLTLFLFINGRWRYDLVALLALLIVVVTGIVPVDRAFSGFSNSAVVTVAAVLVLSQGLQASGLVDVLGGWLSKLRGGIVVQLAALTGLVAFLSAFMNNVGALALLLPVVLQIARQKHFPPSALLMPLAFASLLGGMTTLIGTPPNIIASSFREQATGQPFAMFDFAPVGVGVAVAGLLFIVLVGWRMIPMRRSPASADSLFEIDHYLTELRLPAGSRLGGKRLRDIRDFARAEAIVVGLVRDRERTLDPPAYTRLHDEDILIVNADAESLKQLLESTDLTLVGSQPIESAELQSEGVRLVEAVVKPNGRLVGQTARSLDLRARYGINLLAISRQGRQLADRLDHIRFEAGDVLLLQSHVETQREAMEALGYLPLAARDLKLGQRRRLVLGLGLFAAALLVAALGWLPVQISFVGAALLMIVTRLLSLEEAYRSIDGSIVILLGAMIPVGEALETSGGASLVANSMLGVAAAVPPLATVALLLVVTMFLSDVVNNAAAVVLMAPIGIELSQGLGASVEPFLMAITIGASCAFLTPIGHQSNTLVMGPGGYKFGDYWRMGLVLELIVFAVALPLIAIFWPL